MYADVIKYIGLIFCPLDNISANRADQMIRHVCHIKMTLKTSTMRRCNKGTRKGFPSLKWASVTG